MREGAKKLLRSAGVILAGLLRMKGQRKLLYPNLRCTVGDEPLTHPAG